MKGKSQGFACQNCGKNVPANTDRCTHCGRFFKGVRCPMCHHIGKAGDFVSGCPACNYLANDKSIANKNKTKSKEELPAWFYFASVIILVIFMVAIIFNIFKK